MPLTSKIYIRKEALGFCAAHMTIFPDGTKEPLHGHNYQTELTVELADERALVPFSELKRALAELCHAWDHKLLLPAHASALRVEKNDKTQLEFTMCGRFYSVPSDEAVLLPLSNITCESLAQLMAETLRTTFQTSPWNTDVRNLELRLFETPGQGASVTVDI